MMKNLILLFLILLSGTLQAQNPTTPEKSDSVTSLEKVKDSYKLSGRNLSTLTRMTEFLKEQNMIK